MYMLGVWNWIRYSGTEYKRLYVADRYTHIILSNSSSGVLWAAYSGRTKVSHNDTPNSGKTHEKLL